MKKLLFCLTAIALGVTLASCQKDINTLNKTYWDVVSYEDIFNGSGVYSGTTTGTVYGEYVSGEMNIFLKAWDWTYVENYTPSEYRIVKYTDDELVFELWYMECDVNIFDCNVFDDFRGKKIYVDSDGYYYYFKPNGVAVDVADDYDDKGSIYYYDTTRIYCKRSL